MHTQKRLCALRATCAPLLCRLCVLALYHPLVSRAIVTALFVALSTLAGCASLPASVDRVASHARADVADTALARIAAASLPEGAQAQSGVRLLPGGDQAFDARIALAATAQRSIDAQYYVVADDSAGRQFLRELRDAAQRGVRVRLLIDDLYAGGEDELLAGLCAYENVEVRVFNPLPVRTGGLRMRVLLSLHRIGRVNRRMHNKLFIADNSFAITGGRNIADEYFDRARPANFIDMDALVAGPAVRALSASFDAFWNGPLSYPFESVAAGPRADAPLARERFAARVRHGVRPVPAALQHDAPGQGAIGTQLARGRVELLTAAVRVVADAPDPTDAATTAGAVMDANIDLLRSARTELLVVSPYVVPMPRMIDALSRASEDGARVSVVTNSLATTDEPLVHYGYARYRSAILQMGASLHELMPLSEASGPDNGSGGGSLGRLHAKLAVVDRRWFYLGSINMDRRSAHCNTELGLVVDSPALAAELVAYIERVRIPGSYAVSQSPGSGGLRWSFEREGRRLTLRQEPGSSWGRRLGWSLMSLVVDEDFL